MFDNRLSIYRIQHPYYHSSLNITPSVPHSAEQIDVQVRRLRQWVPTSAPYASELNTTTTEHAMGYHPAQMPISPATTLVGFEYPGTSVPVCRSSNPQTQSQLLQSFLGYQEFDDTAFCQSPDTPTSYCQSNFDNFESYEDIQSVYSESPSSIVSEGFVPYNNMHGSKLQPIQNNILETSTTPSVQSDDSMSSLGPSPPSQNMPNVVDALMQVLEEPSTSLVDDTPPRTSRSGKVRKHRCPLTDCQKAFSQPTHLKIHLRSHTGEKPYVCQISGCNAAFSQLGNLRTHERRHRGEKPRRRSRASSDHVSVSTPKSYECKLDSCRNAGNGTGKIFSQLGNLKAHMNKFHKDTLARLGTHFNNQVYENDHLLSQDELELRTYFKSLYKNCNKGIKGRGKGRRVAVVS